VFSYFVSGNPRSEIPETTGNPRNGRFREIRSIPETTGNPRNGRFREIRAAKFPKQREIRAMDAFGKSAPFPKQREIRAMDAPLVSEAKQRKPFFVSGMERSGFPEIFVSGMERSGFPEIFVSGMERSGFPEIFVSGMERSGFPETFFYRISNILWHHRHRYSRTQNTISYPSRNPCVHNTRYPFCQHFVVPRNLFGF